MGILSQELAFQLNARTRASSSFEIKGSMQTPIPNSKKNSAVLLVNAGMKRNARNYATEKENYKPDVFKTDYRSIGSIDTSNSKFPVTSVSNGRGYGGMSTQMGYSTNLQGSKNEYSRLKLGKNVLNFFHVPRKLIQESVETSVADEFEGLMNLGTVLLKEGEQGLDGRLDVGVASRMLHEAAVRFAAASAINPSSVAAVDAWGTTFLGHGKLKLLLSEKLRDMLLEASTPRKKLDPENTVATLQDMIPKVCEECEKLLVEAGRKFGKAVSLDKNNEFALYNWGLALFYRARLIAVDGLEDAVKDADKIYLAAIDKFEATIRLSSNYNAAAYLSWGLALRDRYWLHGLASKPDIQLLQQAKWASEQAVRAYPNGLEAKVVVQACTEELAQFLTK